MRRGSWIVFGPLLGLSACAQLWGFDDLTSSGDAASFVAMDASDGQEVDGVATVDGPSPDSSDDVSLDDVKQDAVADGSVLDGAEDGSTVGDGALARDAADGAAMAACKSICTTGCCDSHGTCQKGTAVTACGASGVACADCTAIKCGLPTSSCCSSNACSCQTVCF